MLQWPYYQIRKCPKKIQVVMISVSSENVKIHQCFSVFFQAPTNFKEKICEHFPVKSQQNAQKSHIEPTFVVVLISYLPQYRQIFVQVKLIFLKCQVVNLYQRCDFFYCRDYSFMKDEPLESLFTGNFKYIQLQTCSTVYFISSLVYNLLQMLENYLSNNFC